ncbi:hypothetical protein QS426_05770 [Staphylococcus pseudintermedius]|uniref:hypothetical protein n=1 Tax=Staphylococcus pseudintermedius TaxID=283734 RepID=UPI00286DD1F6|nr:hypothetical protein [Staphylococcus pseudintermedius]WMZ77541.1 hypothetical protein QS426_05770 [Staphylococcus pseudintermedius]
MKNIFKVSALSISLGLVGLAGSQAYAAEGTPETQSNDFDGVNYVHNVFAVTRKHYTLNKFLCQDLI